MILFEYEPSCNIVGVLSHDTPRPPLPLKVGRVRVGMMSSYYNIAYS